MLKPKILTTLKDYTWGQFHRDVSAGFVVGIVALPLAIAFAIASGVRPECGLVTAVVAGFLISVLGGSRVQIGGPTGAFVVIVYSIVQKYGMDGLILATLMGGVILVGMGFARFGGVIKFIPYPVVVGFTSGIALIIFSSQMNDFFGFAIANVPADFFSKWIAYARHATTFNPYALGMSAGTVLLVSGCQRWTKKVPGSLIALLVMTVLAVAFHLPVETIGSRFGELPHFLSMPHVPTLDVGMIRVLLPSAMTIAILAGIESLLSAVVADGMIGGRHRSNMELVAQGVANMGSALFGGMPATGAIARTVTNIHNGGRTPVAGVVHALVLMVLIFFLGRWVVFIPLPCLAGILVMVAWHMSEVRSFSMLLRAPRSDVVVLLATFFLTVMIDLTVAIEIGMVLSAFLLIHRLSMAANINTITREFVDEEERDDPNASSKRTLPDGVEIYEVNGPFFFGIAAKFLETVKRLERKPKVQIIRMRHVLSVDATALNVLRDVHRHTSKDGVQLILSGVHAQPLVALERSGLLDEMGRENVLPDIDSALERADKIMQRD